MSDGCGQSPQGHHHHDASSCECGSKAPLATAQELSEMDFERSACGAAVAGDLNRLQALLRKASKATAREKTASGLTPLHYAARAGNEAMCRLLLEHDALVDARSDEGRATPLHRAAIAGQTAVVRLLLSHGAKAELQDVDGENALHKAARGGHADLLELLVDMAEPAAASAVDRHGRTPREVLVAALG